MHQQDSEELKVKFLIQLFVFFSIEQRPLVSFIKILNGHYDVADDGDDDILTFGDRTVLLTKLSSTSNYAAKLLQQLSSMRDEPELCDFRIDINEKRLFCHKFILIAISDYFKAMFNGSFLYQ